jgi:hypothetical protein
VNTERWWSGSACRSSSDGPHAAAIAGITQRAFVAVEAKGETLKLRLHVRGLPYGDFPTVAFYHIARMHFPHLGRGTLAGRLSTAFREDEDAAFVFDARADVRTINALLAKQLFGHARNRSWPIDFEIGNSICTYVPALQDETRVVHAVVVMQMADKSVAYIHGAMPALNEPMMCAWAMIHHNQIVADFDEVTRTLPRKRRRRRSGSE